MENIIDKVKAGLKYDAIRGDAMEVAVFEADVRELVDYVERLELNIKLRNMRGN